MATIELPGTVLGGRYRLSSRIGYGGMAEVYRAIDEVLGREVAVKLLHPGAVDAPARVEAEMRTLARLSHPNIVAIYDAGDHEGRPFFVLELVEGSSLSELLRSGRPEPRRTMEIGVAVADALSYVHARGVVHRDVKPGNVLLGQGGRVQLTDFGVARLMDAAHVTTTGMTVGTAAYLAPEQVTGSDVGPPADVYALGLVLLECLTGRREYVGSALEVALARLHRPPEVPEELPEGWRRLLPAMLRLDPAQRLSAPAAALALRRLQADADATTILPAAPLEATRIVTAEGDAAAPAPRTTYQDRSEAGAEPSAAGVVAEGGRPVPAEPGPGSGRRGSAPVRSGGAGPRMARRGIVVVVLLLAALAAVTVALVTASRNDQTGSTGDAPTVRLPAQIEQPLRELEEEVR